MNFESLDPFQKSKLLILLFQNVPLVMCPDFLREVYECFPALKIKQIPDLKLAITTQCNSEHSYKGFNVVREQMDKTLTLTNPSELSAPVCLCLTLKKSCRS